MDTLDIKDEASIKLALLGSLDILGLVAKFSLGKGTPYLLESLFIRLRHLAYYFSEDSSPLIQYEDKLNDNERSILERIVNVRIASAHPEADQHWLDEHFMISGGMNFKDEDVEIQYGSNKLFLIKEVIFIYKKLREFFSQASELPRLAQHPSWEHQEQELADIEKELVDLLKNPEQLLRDRF